MPERESRSTLVYVLGGIAIAGAVSLVLASWVLALNSRQRADLQESVPGILAATTRINAHSQEVVDRSTAALQHGDYRQALGIADQFNDDAGALETLKAFLASTDAQNLASTRTQLSTALDSNISYLRDLQGLTKTPLLELTGAQSKGAAGALENTLAGYDEAFRSLNVESNPYADGTLALDEGAFTTSLMKASEHAEGLLDDYRVRSREIDAFRRDIQGAYSDYQRLRQQDVGSQVEAEHGGGWARVRHGEYTDSVQILMEATSARESVRRKILAVAASSRQLRKIRNELEQVVSAGISALGSGKRAIQSFWEDNPCDSHAWTPGDRSWGGASCQMPLSQFGPWVAFMNSSGSVGGRLAAWQRHFQSALNKEQGDLQRMRDELRDMGIEP